MTRELTPVLIQSQSYTFVQFVQWPGTVWEDLSLSPSLRLQVPGAEVALHGASCVLEPHLQALSVPLRTEWAQD